MVLLYYVTLLLHGSKGSCLEDVPHPVMISIDYSWQGFGNHNGHKDQTQVHHLHLVPTCTTALTHIIVIVLLLLLCIAFAMVVIVLFCCYLLLLNHCILVLCYCVTKIHSDPVINF